MVSMVCTRMSVLAFLARWLRHSLSPSLSIPLPLIKEGACAVCVCVCVCVRARASSRMMNLV